MVNHQYLFYLPIPPLSDIEYAPFPSTCHKNNNYKINVYKLLVILGKTAGMKF